MLDQFPQPVTDWVVSGPIGRQYGGCLGGCGGSSCLGAPPATHRSQNQRVLDLTRFVLAYSSLSMECREGPEVTFARGGYVFQINLTLVHKEAKQEYEVKRYTN